MKLYFTGLFLTIAVSLLVTTSCSQKSNLAVKIEPMNITFKVSKGRSAKKPAYSVEIKDKEVTYNGIANVAVLGELTYELTNQEYKTVHEAFSESEFQSFEESYKGRMRDLPIFTLAYNGKTIKYQEREAPEELLALAQIIISIFPKSSN